MPFCSYFGCNKRCNEGSYFPIKDSLLCVNWVARTKREKFTPTRNSFVCQEHFLSEDWTINTNGKRVLKAGTIPQPAKILKSNEDEAQANKKQRSLLSRKHRAERRQSLPEPLREENCKQANSSGDPCLDRDSVVAHDLVAEAPAPVLNDDTSPIISPDCSISVTSGAIVFSPQILAVAKDTITPIKISCEAAIESVTWSTESNDEASKILQHELEINKLMKRILELEDDAKKESHLRQNLNKIYSAEQMNILSEPEVDGKRRKVQKWSDSAILNGIQRRFVHGTSGYEDDFEKGEPIPAIRTLQERTEGFKCSPGADENNFIVFCRRVQALSCDGDKDFILANDEINLTSGKQYDSSTGQIIGDCTLPLHTGIGSKGMVWVVAGVRRRVKQPIAYHVTPTAVNGTAIRLVNEELIKKLESEAGVRIIAYVTDMAPCNLNLWNDFCIIAKRKGPVTFSIPHPCDPSRRLVIMPDSPHLAKNLKASLANNQCFKLGEATVKKYNLPTDEVSWCHILTVQQTEQQDDIYLAPQLQKAKLKPNTFDQMKVQNTTYVLNDTTAATLEYFAAKLNEPSLLTTAWFCRMFHKWFTLMTASSPKNGLSHLQPEKFAQAKSDLVNFMELMRDLYVRGGWKPWQRGILVATTGYLFIAEELLAKPDYSFVLEEADLVLIAWKTYFLW